MPALEYYNGEIVKARVSSDKAQPLTIQLPHNRANNSVADTVDEIFAVLVNRDILSKLFIITRENYPRLTEAYEQLCMANGLHNAPPLLGTKSSLITAAALPDYDCILLAEDTLYFPVDKTLSIIGHEMGHLLDRHNDPKKSEQAADSFSVHFMGKTRSVIGALKRTESVLAFTRAFIDMLDYSEDRAFSKMTVRLAERSEQERYGKASDRLAFIKAQNPEDRGHIEAVIEARNALPRSYKR
jgi:hypothetical protein